MASKVIGVMLRHDDGDKEYYEPNFTEEDINAIYKILDKYGDENDSKRGELEVVDMTERIDKLFKAMRSEIGVMAEYGDNEDRLKEELSTCGEKILREYERRYLNMNEREYIIGKAKELGITAQELGIQPEIKTVTEKDKQLIHEISEYIKYYEDDEMARDYFNEKYWEDLGIQKKKYKIVKCKMEKTIYRNIYVAMPEDEDTDRVNNYIEGTDYLDNDNTDDEEEWEVNDYNVDEWDLTEEDVDKKGEDVWNQDTFAN